MTDIPRTHTELRRTIVSEDALQLTDAAIILKSTAGPLTITMGGGRVDGEYQALLTLNQEATKALYRLIHRVAETPVLALLMPAETLTLFAMLEVGGQFLAGTDDDEAEG